MKRGDLLKAIAALPIVGTLFASPASAEPTVHAKPGDVLVFQVESGEDVSTLHRQLRMQPIAGVSVIVVNKSVTPALLEDFLKRRRFDEPDITANRRWGQYVADFQGALVPRVDLT
jgi:hypothetical protein